MAKFVVVKERPSELKTGEYLIDEPSFLDEIKLHKTKAAKNGLTAPFHLRMILDSIAQKYDPENMTAYSVKVHNFEGREFKSDEDLNKIVVEMLRSDYPAVFAKYLESKIRNRPQKTQLVYYVDSNIRGAYELFYKNGLDDNKEETLVKEKSTKTVGKPAITKEQAEALKQSNNT